MTDAIKPQNPSAFPRPMTEIPNGAFDDGENGMTLRDYFAAKAMQGILAGNYYNAILTNNGEDSFIVERAYELADAMLAEREKGGSK